MENVSYCPYRTTITSTWSPQNSLWTQVQETQYSEPVVFRPGKEPDYALAGESKKYLISDDSEDEGGEEFNTVEESQEGVALPEEGRLAAGSSDSARDMEDDEGDRKSENARPPPADPEPPSQVEPEAPALSEPVSAPEYTSESYVPPSETPEKTESSSAVEAALEEQAPESTKGGAQEELVVEKSVQEFVNDAPAPTFSSVEAAPEAPSSVPQSARPALIRPSSSNLVHFAEDTLPPAPDRPSTTKSKDKKSMKEETKKEAKKKVGKPANEKAPRMEKPSKPLKANKIPAPVKSWEDEKKLKADKAEKSEKSSKRDKANKTPEPVKATDQEKSKAEKAGTSEKSFKTAKAKGKKKDKGRGKDKGGKQKAIVDLPEPSDAWASAAKDSSPHAPSEPTSSPSDVASQPSETLPPSEPDGVAPKASPEPTNVESRADPRSGTTAEAVEETAAPVKLPVQSDSASDPTLAVVEAVESKETIQARIVDDSAKTSGKPSSDPANEEADAVEVEEESSGDNSPPALGPGGEETKVGDLLPAEAPASDPVDRKSQGRRLADEASSCDPVAKESKEKPPAEEARQHEAVSGEPEMALAEPMPPTEEKGGQASGESSLPLRFGNPPSEEATAAAVTSTSNDEISPSNEGAIAAEAREEPIEIPADEDSFPAIIEEEDAIEPSEPTAENHRLVKYVVVKPSAKQALVSPGEEPTLVDRREEVLVKDSPIDTLSPDEPPSEEPPPTEVSMDRPKEEVQAKTNPIPSDEVVEDAEEESSMEESPQSVERSELAVEEPRLKEANPEQSTIGESNFEKVSAPEAQAAKIEDALPSEESPVNNATVASTLEPAIDQSIDDEPSEHPVKDIILERVDNASNPSIELYVALEETSKVFAIENQSSSEQALIEYGMVFHESQEEISAALEEVKPQEPQIVDDIRPEAENTPAKTELPTLDDNAGAEVGANGSQESKTVDENRPALENTTAELSEEADAYESVAVIDALLSDPSPDTDELKEEDSAYIPQSAETAIELDHIPASAAQQIAPQAKNTEITKTPVASDAPLEANEFLAENQPCPNAKINKVEDSRSSEVLSTSEVVADEPNRALSGPERKEMSGPVAHSKLRIESSEGKAVDTSPEESAAGGLLGLHGFKGNSESADPVSLAPYKALVDTPQIETISSEGVGQAEESCPADEGGLDAKGQESMPASERSAVSPNEAPLMSESAAKFTQEPRNIETKYASEETQISVNENEDAAIQAAEDLSPPPAEAKEPGTENKEEDTPIAEEASPVKKTQLAVTKDKQANSVIKGNPLEEVMVDSEKVEKKYQESLHIPDDAAKETEEPVAETTPPPDDAAEEIDHVKQVAISDDARKEMEGLASKPLQCSNPPRNEASEVLERVEKNSIPVAKFATPGDAIGIITATLDINKVIDKELVDEPKQLDDIVEEKIEMPLEEPPSTRSDKRSSKYTSARQSTHSNRHSSSMEKDNPSDESHRPHSHRKHRDSGNSLKALFIPLNPKRPDRHDSGFSEGVGGSPKIQRDLKEQAVYDNRKAEYRFVKSKVSESESLVIGATAILPSKALRRMSSRRESTPHGEKEGEKTLITLDMRKRLSAVKSPFLAMKDEPHGEEEVMETKKSNMQRPTSSIDGERPDAAVVKEKGRVHWHTERVEDPSTGRDSKEDKHRREKHQKDKHDKEKDPEARKVRKEADRQLFITKAEVNIDMKLQVVKDHEDWSGRDEPQRKREAETSAKNIKGKGREGERAMDSTRKPRSNEWKGGERSERSDPHQGKRREKRIMKEEKTQLKSIWSSAKKVFS